MEHEFEGSDEHSSSGSVLAERAKHSSFAEVVARVAALLVETDGSLSLGGEALMALKSHPERQKILQELIGTIAPPEIVKGYWQQWLTGGIDPVPMSKMVKPGNIDRSTGKVFGRADKARAAASKKIEDARKKVESAQEVLRRAEHEADILEANEKAALLWTIADHMLSIMAGTFAVGPAWTIMRAISGYISDAELERAGNFALSASDRDATMREAAEEKKEETATMLSVLDQHCGNSEFESELRQAVLSVVTKFKDRDPDETSPMHRRRGKETMRSSVQPAGQKNSEEILDGFLVGGI